MQQADLIQLVLDPGSLMTTEPFSACALAERTIGAQAAACRSSTARYIGLGGLSSSIPAAVLQESVRRIEAGDADVLLLPLGGYEWLELMTGVPAPILARVPYTTEGAILLVRRDRLLETVSRLDSQNPVNGVLACLADGDNRIRICLQSDIRTAAASLTSFVPPALVPGEKSRSESGLERFLDFECPAVLSRDDLVAVRSGLFQLHDALGRSHVLAQSVEGRGRHQAGDYWHAIMHRREPDYANSKYWFRHVGRHPVHAELPRHASAILANAEGDDCARWRSRLLTSDRWDPLAFVDLCEQFASSEDSPLGQAARRIQWVEMLLLLRSTCEDAFRAGTIESESVVRGKDAVSG